MTDPRKIARYNAQLTFNGTDWVRIEQFNTLGTVTFDGSVDDQPAFDTSALLRENYTTVNCTPIKASGDQNIQILSISENSIVLFAQETPANGDIILVQIEVINI